MTAAHLPATVNTPLLMLAGVSRHFQTGSSTTKVLDNINLTIGAGEMVAIMGPSGSGKSTLMNILGCLDTPSSGSYRVDGQDVQQLNNDARAQLRRERFGFIFQRYHLISSLSVQDNVEVPARYAHHCRAYRQDKARHLLRQLGLAGFEQRNVIRLSGGQQQRVSIARALINRGDIILADEPTGALDSQNGQEVMQLLQHLHHQGHTVIIITHDAQVAGYAERVIQLADGKIIADQPQAAAGDHLSTLTFMPTQQSADNLPSTAPACWQTAWSNAYDILRSAWQTLRMHRLRTGLTLLGIVIGIVSVVSLNALGDGAKQYVLNNMKKLGGNAITLYPGRGGGDDQASGLRALRPRDLTALSEPSWIRAVSPSVNTSLRVRWQRADTNAMVNGVGASFLQASNKTLTMGRGLLPWDIEQQSSAVVIDEPMRKKLFPAGFNPLDQLILVGTLPCRVVGVVQDQSSSGNTLNLWLPWTTVNSRLLGQNWFNSITISVDESMPTAAATQAIQQRLTRLHGRKDFFISDSAAFISSINKTSLALTLFLSLVALISLTVGGIGVMNIMLVSVTERTRETGIRMAVGARQHDIQYQFLTEAILLCLLGASLGVLLSLAISAIFSVFIHSFSMVFSAKTLLIAVVSAITVGILSGWLPARQASRLDPAEALARE